MRIKRTVLAPVILALGSFGILAGSVAPIVASSAVAASAATTSGDPNSIIKMG